jgi:hypothetical protein
MISEIEQLANDVRHLTAPMLPVASNRSEACSRAAKTRWQNPAYRAYQKSLRRTRHFPEQAETLRKRWADPAFRAMMIEARKA